MPKTLLFLSSSPSDQAKLRVAAEQRDITEALKRSNAREDFRLITSPATRFKDLINALREEQPWLVHFGGHGDGTLGLVLEDEQGKPAHLKNEVLLQFIQLLKGQTQCVFLNACYSNVQAELIAAHIPYVVAMNARVPDSVALEFAQQFYAGLGAGHSIEMAFHWAKVGLLAFDQSGAHIPVLYKQGKSSESEELAAKQRDFVQRIFEEYVYANIPRPVMILAQEGFQTQHYIRALKTKAIQRFGSCQVLHIFPPASQQVSEAEYFNYLAQHSGLGEAINTSFAWGQAMQQRFAQGRELFLLVTGFENGSERYRHDLAGELRNLLSSADNSLHLVLFGGERLAATKYELGALSFLSGMDEEPLPPLCHEDIRTLYLPADKAAAIADHELQQILEFSGQHPRLVQACLTELGKGEVNWRESVKNSHIPAQLFNRVSQEPQLCEYLHRDQFGHYNTWSQDRLERALYWQNLLMPRNGRLVWRCDWLRALGKELLGC